MLTVNTVPAEPTSLARKTFSVLRGLSSRIAGQFFGLGVGVVFALAILVWASILGPLIVLSFPFPPFSRRLRAWGVAGLETLVAVEVWRLSRWLDCDIRRREEDQGSGLAYLLIRIPIGFVTGFLLYNTLFTIALLFGGAVWAGTAGDPSPIEISLPGVGMSPRPWTLGIFLGLLLVALTIGGAALLAAGDRALARRLLGPDDRDRLERRISELTESRAAVLAAVDDERRRIERDLHDGVQQTTVALAMLLGRARRRTGSEAEDLLHQAHDQSLHLVDELRDVAWRVYPRTLDELGLSASLATIADSSAIALSVRDNLTRRPSPTTEIAIYFVAREAITNALKHANATEITVTLDEEQEPTRDILVVRIQDDGQGGADLHSGGLQGLHQRVAALDGTFELHSPVGGPTVITASVPGGSTPH